MIYFAIYSKIKSPQQYLINANHHNCSLSQLMSLLYVIYGNCQV
nr:MAG TPA: hypothetical protein [Caudoviricetes sp.]